MAFKLKRITTVLRKAFKNWIDKDPFRESSVIAYSAIFSLPGLMVVIVTVAGYFFGSDLVNSEIHSTISGAMGKDTADQIEDMIIYALSSKDSVIASIIGITTMLIGATGVFVQLQKSLNIIWEVEATEKKSGIWNLLKLRLFSFGLILSIAFLLLVSLVISSLLSAAAKWIKQQWDESLLWIFSGLEIFISLAIITILFGMMFRILPDARIKWRTVWIGGFLTALLFTLGKTLLGLYFGKAEPGSGYGAAGSVILVMLWVSYSSAIFFYGAEFTRAYSDEHYGSVPANDIAVKKRGRVK